MEKHKIIYIEGVPSSGKTTVIKRLSRKFPKQIDTVPEYIELHEGKRAEITHDPSYFKLNDERKWKNAENSSKKHVFVDRGHLSTVIYNLLDFRFNKNPEALQIIDWYFDTVLSNGRVPDCYIFLETPPEISFKRRDKVLVSHNLWDNEKAVGIANGYYLKLMRSYEPDAKIFRIRTDEMTMDELEKKITDLFGLVQSPA